LEVVLDREETGNNIEIKFWGRTMNVNPLGMVAVFALTICGAWRWISFTMQAG
jgi:hypothetical protein